MPDLPTGTVTLLFTDIEGSTRLLQQLGKHYIGMLAGWRQLLRETFEACHGHEVDTQGDAFFVVFARARDAISAAVTIQRTLASHSWPEGVVVRVRMGLHTGEPSLASEGYVGLDVHFAARLMGAGHGGQVLLSQATRALVEHDLPQGMRLRDLGEHHLKDIGRPSRLFQLVIAGLPADFPPLKTLDTSSNKLPIPPTSFIGREQAAATVGETLRRADVRLLTLIGTPGVGKTRLALNVAAEAQHLFPDGVFFVALSLVSDALMVVPAIAQTLGVGGAGEANAQSQLESLKAHLHEKQVLLVLDNFEQLMDAALIVAELLVACPKLKILVTSRVALHVQAEHTFVVPPLAVPDPKHLPDLAALSQNEAVALFIKRAQAVRSDFQLTDANASAVASICARLDGLPLAIELAAARIQYFPPEKLLTRLEQGLAILTGGARDLPARQQTLRGAIAWSYELLDIEQQQLFRRLAVFENGCTLEAAEQVCTAAGELDGDILEGLEALVDNSLLRQEQQGQQGDSETRFWQMQTLREYGLECLASAGEMEATRDAHARYYLARAEEATPNMVGAGEARWLDRLEQEYQNLRAALEWMLKRAGKDTKQAERALRLCVALMDFWEVRGYFREGRSFLERALATSEGVMASIRLEALYAAGFLALMQGDDDRAEALLQDGLALFRETGDKLGMAKSLRILGNLASARNTYTTACSFLEQALALYRELGDQQGMAFTREVLAQVSALQGSYTRARVLLEENLSLYRALDEKYNAAYPLYHLARVYFLSRGDQEKALAMAEESLALFREVGNKRFIAYVLSLLGQLLLQRDEGTSAPIRLANAAQAGRMERARELCEESVRTFKALEYPIGVTESLLSLARVLAYQGEVIAARACYEESWAFLKERDARELSATCLEGLGELVIAQGAARWAARLWAIAAALRAAIGAPMPRVYRASYERAVAAAREQLGKEAFTAAWAEGRTMLPEQALVQQG